MYKTVGDRVINDQNQVAVSYYTCVPHVIGVMGTEYAFTVKANICMAWINPEHVDAVLRVKKNCCGNNSKTVYRLEHEDHTRRWTNGGGR
jgi:hypothetical protein